MTLTGFEHVWFFLFLFVVLGLVVLYILGQFGAPCWMQQFANTEMLESVAPKRPSRWRHLRRRSSGVVAGVFTVAMAGPTHDVRIPRNRAGDAGDRRVAVDEGDRCVAQPDGCCAGGCQAVRRSDDARRQPGADLLCGHCDGAGAPTTNRDASKVAIDKLQVADRTATGEGIFTALQAISTVGAVIGGGHATACPHRADVRR